MIMEPIGDLFGRKVHVLTGTWLCQETGCDALDHASTMFWVSREQDLIDFQAHLSGVIQSSPLVIFVAGPLAEVGFDALLQELSVGPQPAHIMTNMSAESLEDCLEEFFQASWPSEERLDHWRRYVLVVGDQQLATVTAAAREYLQRGG